MATRQSSTTSGSQDSVVGAFRIGKEIGRGSFATVYQGVHLVSSFQPFSDFKLESFNKQQLPEAIKNPRLKFEFRFVQVSLRYRQTNKSIHLENKEPCGNQISSQKQIKSKATGQPRI